MFRLSDQQFDQLINAYRTCISSLTSVLTTEVYFYVLLCRSGTNAVSCCIGSWSAQLNASLDHAFMLFEVGYDRGRGTISEYRQILHTGQK